MPSLSRRTLESSVDRIPDSLRTGVVHAPIIDYEPPPVGITACPAPPLDVAGRSPVPALHRHHAPAPVAAPRRAAPDRHRRGGGRLRRRGAAPGARGRRPAQAHRAASTARDARAHRHGLRAGQGRRTDKAAVLRRVRLRSWSTSRRRRPPRCSRRTPAGRRVRAIGRIELTDDRWRIVALQLG